MKRNLSVSKFLLLSMIALGSLNAFGSQIFCSQGQPVGAQTGFFKISDDLSCPQHSVRCVENAKCPRPLPANCPADSIFQSTITGFNDIADGNLACPVYSGGCVNPSKCPVFAPIKCDHGSVETAVIGYRKIDAKYSCPIVEMACVDILKCPFY